MDQQRLNLEAWVNSIESRRREIEWREAQLKTLDESVRELQGKLSSLRNEQASDTAQMCAMAVAMATRPEPSSPRRSSTATSHGASSLGGASRSEGDGRATGSDEDVRSDPGLAEGSPQHASPKARPRWRRFRTRDQRNSRRTAPGERTTGVTPARQAPRVEAEGILRLRIPYLVPMSEAKVEAILRGRARGVRNRLDLGFRHLSPRVRSFSVIRPATVPFRKNPSGNAPRGFAAAVRELAHRHIRKAGKPLNRNEIVDLVSGSGMPLPKNNLKQKVSKILLEDPDLVNERGVGYTIQTRRGS